MINTLEDYIWRSLPEYGSFSTNVNLNKKVSPQGALLPYMGNTVVFLLNEAVKQQLKKLQEELYRVAYWMLAEPLQESTFHMTLHDLANGPTATPELWERMADAEQKTKEILPQWRNQPPLRMHTTWLFNMVNTSIVLGLVPADGDSWRRLEVMYNTLESVVHLGYGLTPHITMAYFRPGTYSQDEVQALRTALHPVDLELELRMEDLVFQTFSDMNHYETKS